MAYTTAAKAAALAGVEEADIQVAWLAWADQLIDVWRGEDYPPTADPITEEVDGTGSGTIYLSTSPISGVTSVSIDGDLLSAATYGWHKAGYIRRKTTSIQHLSPYMVREAWPEGVGNIEVVYTPVAHADLLDAVAASIVAKMAVFAANGGALKAGGFTVGDYSEKGGTFFGDRGLDGDVRSILETMLPKKRRFF